MLLLGIVIGLSLSAIPHIISFHNTCCSIDPENTIQKSLYTLSEMGILYVEQTIRKSIAYDKSEKKYILSFVLAGKLYKLYIRQLIGPESRRIVDPFERGRLSIT